MRTKHSLLWVVILSVAALAVVGLPARSSAALPQAPTAQSGSGIWLTASIGPSCLGITWDSAICARPYIGEFVVTALNGTEIARVMTNYWGQARVDLVPGRYLVGVMTDNVYPRAAPVVVDIVANRYAFVALHLEAGPPEQTPGR